MLPRPYGGVKRPESSDLAGELGEKDQFYSSVDAAVATSTVRDGFCSWLVKRRSA